MYGTFLFGGYVVYILFLCAHFFTMSGICAHNSAEFNLFDNGWNELSISPTQKNERAKQFPFFANPNREEAIEIEVSEPRKSTRIKCYIKIPAQVHNSLYLFEIC